MQARRGDWGGSAIVVDDDGDTHSVVGQVAQPGRPNGLAETEAHRLMDLVYRGQWRRFEYADLLPTQRQIELEWTIDPGQL
jgi:hypothetical protein